MNIHAGMTLSPPLCPSYLDGHLRQEPIRSVSSDWDLSFRARSVLALYLVIDSGSGGMTTIYSRPLSVINGFWVALLIAAQLVVNTSTTAVQKGTTNHHGKPALLLIK